MAAVTKLARVMIEREESAPTETGEAWQRFLVNEGLDVLAAYRSIQDNSVRAMFIRLMKEAAKAERNKRAELN